MHQAFDIGSGRRKQLERRLCPALGVFKISCQPPYLTCVDAMFCDLAVTGLDISRSERNAHKSLTKIIKMRIEMHREARGIDDSAHLQIVSRKHDAEITCAPLDMAAARRHCKPKVLVDFARLIEIVYGDDGVIDGLNAIM